MGFVGKTYNRLRNGEKIEDIIADVRSNAVPDKPKRSQPEKPKQPEPQPEPQPIDVKDRLAHIICSDLSRVARKAGPRAEYLDGAHCLAIWNMDSTAIENAISQATSDFEERYKEEYPGVKWQLVEVDADHVARMADEMKAIGSNGLITLTDDSVITYRGLPLIARSAIQQIGFDGPSAEVVNETVKREGFGVLFLKNINENNYQSLGFNFIYNLTKHHVFNYVRLSHQWQVIMEVGPGVVLDTTSSDLMHFNAKYYHN